MFNNLKWLCAMSAWLFTGLAMAFPPIGGRKYLMDYGAKTETVKIISSATKADGSFMKDPVMGSNHGKNKGPQQTAHKGAGSDIEVPVVTQAEKTFQPLAIEGSLSNPRIGFKREYLDLTQLEDIEKPAYSDALIRELKTFEN